MIESEEITTTKIQATLVSVLMPVYNVERYLKEAIESVLHQTMSQFELVIIDDGSSDNSKQIIAEYEKKDARIKFLSRQNKGIVATRNELLSLAKGKYFAIMDSDDISCPNRLQEQLDFLENNKNYVIVGCRDLLIDPEGCPIMVINNIFEHDEIDAANLRTDDFLTLNAYMAVTKLVRDVGAYRTDVVYAEDRDLFLRLAEIGKVSVLPKVLYKYRQHFQSVCAEKTDEINSSVAKVIKDAINRRKLDIPLITHNSNPNKKIIQKEDYYTTWAWFALQNRNYKTANKYAIKLLITQPLSLSNWNLIYCIFRDQLRNTISFN